MHRYNSFVASIPILLALVCFAGSASAVDPGVCGRGLGEPPFLSTGVDSNLLLLLDNSGSMLDMAYLNKLANTQCYDDSFNKPIPPDPNLPIYAGNYNRLIPVAPPAVPTETAWYKWVDGLNPWMPGKAYVVGDKIYANGVVYRAVTAGTSSTGSNVYSDTGVVWENMVQPKWRKNTFYRAGSFVLSPTTLYVYRTVSGGTSSNTAAAVSPETDAAVTWQRILSWAKGTNYAANTYVLWKNSIYQSKSAGLSAGDGPVDDTGVTWVEVDPLAWKSGVSYQLGEIVTYLGMIYEANTPHLSAGLTLFADNNVSGVNYWTRIDEGYYEMINAAAAQAVCTAAATAGGTKYSSSDLCIVKAANPDRMTAFAATGNMLNWLMSSKFDIEKSILTGGKYSSGNISGNTSGSRRLISENRGCSGSRFVKEVAVSSGGTTYKLTMAVRAPRNEGDPMRKDRVDISDDTTRVEVLGITTTGYNVAACQLAIERILAKDLNGSQAAVDACLGAVSGGIEEKARAALNHALQTCWQNDTNDPDAIWKHLQTNVNDCQDLYGSIAAADIPSYSQAYNCFGYYDPNVLHSDRFGYVGRCWGGGCNPAKISNPTSCSTKNPYPCEFTYTEPSGTLRNLRNVERKINKDTVVITEICTEVGAGACTNPGDWNAYYTNSVGSLCNPNDAAYATGWSTEIDPTDIIPPDDVDPSVAAQNKITLGGGAKLSDQSYVCVSAAMKDFCADSTAPEVIDASDQSVSTTGTYGNLPAQLIDSGVLSQLGVDVPLAVMKGYAKQSTQPVGILQKNAENLRIGAMAFNTVGSTTECQQAVTNDKIERYCPAGNQDGAQVIAPVRSGTLIIDEKVQADPADDRLHVHDVVDAVNLVRATAWTPLAEAMYSAIGYYTQNAARRLNPDDFQTDADLPWAAGKTYAPGSYALSGSLLYKTVLGGTSTAGFAPPALDPGVVWSPVGTYKGNWVDSTTYVKNAIVSSAGKLFFTAYGGTSKLKTGAPVSLWPSTLFDEGVIWEPLLDPVVYSCQENHILAITEGASTADINIDIPAFIADATAFIANPIHLVYPPYPVIDPSIDTQGQCTGGLLGSTYLDDLTYFAWGGGKEGTEFVIYPSGNETLPSFDAPFDPQTKNNLTTHIVVAGSLRNSGTGECNPATLMQNAAANGGTEKPVLGESPAQMEAQLNAIFNELRQRASAGSAASVISSARGGEGAIYQAIFWPELVRQEKNAAKTEYKVAWAGDVHGLFLDENGYMYEDTNHDRTMKPTEDLDNDGRFDGGECTLDTNGKVVCADSNNDGRITKTEDLNGDGVFNQAIEDLDKDFHFDNVYEDVNDNGTWEHDNTRDKRIVIYFDKYTQKSRACYDTSILQSLGGNCTSSRAFDLEQVKFLWSVNDWLSDYPVDSTGAHSPNPLVTELNRTFHISNERKRYIFTWNDMNNDGIVDYTANPTTNEVIDLVAPVGSTAWNGLAKDFNAANGIEVNNIISWLRGKDWLIDEDPNGNGIVDAGEPGDIVSGDGPLRDPLRSRKTVLASDGITPITWRLGDIIHSTPQTVAAPAEGYHLLYNDRSYAQFVNQYKKRRHVVYFGANDGMLHAVNAGFYSDIEKKFCLKKPLDNGMCPTNDGTGISTDYPNGAPDLGTELWAYVPYNLQPHLKCLLSPLYSHKYFVDLKPRVFDAQIFKPDGDHPFGWGTILVGGLRFGGAPVSAAEIAAGFNQTETTNRQFISSYFIMDITNPEKQPVLLGELTQKLNASSTEWVDLGYSTVIPTMVVAKSRQTGATDATDATINNNRWYLVFGSGPHGPNGVKGVSDQKAKVSILPLGGVIGSTTSLNGTLVDGFVGIGNRPTKPMRIPKGPPSSTSPTTGTFELPILSPNTDKAFVSDPITVDFDINPSNSGQYVADAVYFGTVEGEFAKYPDGTDYWKGGGHLYRLVMNGAGHEIKKDDPTTPYDSTTGVGKLWEIKPLIDLTSKLDSTEPDLMTSKPITSAPSVGTDGHNYWIYFGTGRFFDADDKTDRHQQSFFGIKEPMDSTGKLTWAEVKFTGTGTSVPGGKGLLKVDEIMVPESSSGSALLACRDNTNGGLSASKTCLPAASIDTFDELESHIAGTGTCDPATLENNCVDGWYKNFYPYKNRERNIGQATLLGGLVTFTTYQPFTDVCRAEGNSYLYGVHYKTGTSWYENVFGAYGTDNYGVKYVRNKLDLGRGMTTTPNLYVGSGKENDGVKAFVQTSTGAIMEIRQDNLPLDYKTGRESWKEVDR